MVQAWGCDVTLRHMAVSINIDVGIGWDGKKQIHNNVDQGPESQIAVTVRETAVWFIPACGARSSPQRPATFLAKSKVSHL
jgi:hypothetical protein